MTLPGFTAEATLNRTNERYRGVGTVTKSEPTLNSVQPAAVCVVYEDWFDFWLETGIVSEYGGMICRR
jgi:hypothetical protein